MNFEVITLAGKVYQAEITAVGLPTPNGEITVLPDHMPLFTLLTSGKIKVMRKEHNTETEDYLKINGGFAEIRPDFVTVMADNFENI